MADATFFIHCRVKPGGALNVLERLIVKELQSISGKSEAGLPSGKLQAFIYTLYSDRDTFVIYQKDPLTGTMVERVIPIITAMPRWLNRIFARADRVKPAVIGGLLDYRNLFVIYPWLMSILSRKLARQVRRLRHRKHLHSHDMHIVISSFAVAKNITRPKGIFTTIYFHQPMHYVWTLYDQYVQSFHGWKRWLYERVTPRLRRRDSKRRYYDQIYTNSIDTADQVRKIYHLHDSHMDVVHCPIDPVYFDQTIVTKPKDYFIYVGRLATLFKEVDKLIHACNALGLNLLIAGDGPDRTYLQSIAGPTITFLGRVSDIQTKIDLVKHARGFLGIAYESFGIVTAEALLLGVPVFAYARGGSAELVDEQSGVLIDHKDNETIVKALRQFAQHDFDRQQIQDHARKILLPLQSFWSDI